MFPGCDGRKAGLIDGRARFARGDQVLIAAISGPTPKILIIRLRVFDGLSSHAHGVGHAVVVKVAQGRLELLARGRARSMVSTDRECASRGGEVPFKVCVVAGATDNIRVLINRQNGSSRWWRR